MKTLDEVITALDVCTQSKGCKLCPYSIYDEDGFNLYDDCPSMENDALQWLKGYKAHIELDKLRDKYGETSQELRNTSQISCPKCHSEFVILPESNPALTWDELKQMEGKPVWLEDSNQQGEWVLLSGMEDDVLYFVYRTCNEYKIYRKEQGTLWQAYRKERA